jgi:hypothetical protein
MLQFSNARATQLLRFGSISPLPVILHLLRFLVYHDEFKVVRALGFRKPTSLQKVEGRDDVSSISISVSDLIDLHCDRINAPSNTHNSLISPCKCFRMDHGSNGSC